MCRARSSHRSTPPTQFSSGRRRRRPTVSALPEMAHYYNFDRGISGLQCACDMCGDDIDEEDEGMCRRCEYGECEHCGGVLDEYGDCEDCGGGDDESGGYRRCCGTTQRGTHCQIDSSSVTSHNRKIAQAAQRLYDGHDYCGFHADQERYGQRSGWRRGSQVCCNACGDVWDEDELEEERLRAIVAERERNAAEWEKRELQARLKLNVELAQVVDALVTSVPPDWDPGEPLPPVMEGATAEPPLHEAHVTLLVDRLVAAKDHRTLHAIGVHVWELDALERRVAQQPDRHALEPVEAAQVQVLQPLEARGGGVRQLGDRVVTQVEVAQRREARPVDKGGDLVVRDVDLLQRGALLERRRQEEQRIFRHVELLQLDERADASGQLRQLVLARRERLELHEPAQNVGQRLQSVPVQRELRQLRQTPNRARQRRQPVVGEVEHAQIGEPEDLLRHLLGARVAEREHARLLGALDLELCCGGGVAHLSQLRGVVAFSSSQHSALTRLPFTAVDFANRSGG